MRHKARGLREFSGHRPVNSRQDRMSYLTASKKISNKNTIAKIHVTQGMSFAFFETTLHKTYEMIPNVMPFEIE